MDKKYYKVGDRVRIVDKWGPGCYQNRDGKMDKWLGKVMTVREVCREYGEPYYYHMLEDRDENLAGWGWSWSHASIAGLAETEKIIITTDGKTTQARRYIGGNLAGKAEAKLAPGDVFDFDTGARLAFGRLVGPAYDPDEVKLTKPAPAAEKKYRVLDREPEPGDLIRLTDKANYSFNRPGDILPVYKCLPSGVVAVKAIAHPRRVGTGSGGVWHYQRSWYELVEEIKPAGGLKVGDRVRTKNIPVKAWERLAGAEGTLVHNDGTGFAPWVVELDRPRGFEMSFTDPDFYGKKGHCIWAEPRWLDPLPQPDEAKVKNPLQVKEMPCGPYMVRFHSDGSATLRERTDEHPVTVTIDEACGLPAAEILHMLRDNLQEVTFTADGDIIAKFK